MAILFSPLSHKRNGRKFLSTNFITRLFEEKDLGAVVHINATCLPENYNDSFFIGIRQKFSKTFLVATVAEKVVGYIMCRVEIGFSDWKKIKIRKKGHVISIAVLSEYREQGIASALLSEALRNISEYNVDECYLEVRVSNNSAIDLYKRLDFQIIRTVHRYYLNGEDAYVMSKALTNN